VATGPGAVTVLLGNGDGTFTPTASPSAVAIPNAIAVADFNGDGIPDLALTSESEQPATVTVLLGKGDGTFTNTQVSLAADNQGIGIVAGDFNGDGIPDLAVLSVYSLEGVYSLDVYVTTLFGDGMGNFTETNNTTLAFPLEGGWDTAPNPIAAGDFNGDGVTDLAIDVDYSELTVLLSENQTASAPASGIALPPGSGTQQVVAAYGGDTNFKASTSAATSLKAAVGTPAVSVAASPNPAPVGSAVTLTATVSGGGLTPTGNTTFNDNFGQLGTASLNTSGVASYTTSALTVGTYAITADYSGDPNYKSADSTPISLKVIPTNPVPLIGSISPAFTYAGGAAFTLSVNGSSFTSASTVYWGSSSLATVYVSATKLTASVTAADITPAGKIAITVQTPAPGGGTSNSLQFEVDSSGSGWTPPAFTTLTATVAAGSTASYTVTLPASVQSASVTCLNLPSGASCNYSSTTNAVTITTSSTTPAGTYQITVVFTETVPGAASAGILLPLLLLPLLVVRKKLAARGTWTAACLGMVLITAAVFSIGCGGSNSTATPPPATHQVTSSGAVTLTVQ